MLGHDRRDVMEWLERLLALVQRSGPAGHHGDERIPMTLLGDEGKGRGDLKCGEAAHLFRSVFDVVAIEAQDVTDVLQLKEHGTAVNVLDRVHTELERCQHSEVAASTADGPEKVFVLSVAGHQESAIGSDNVGRDQVVEREAEPTGEIADSTAKGETGDARGRDDASRRGQPKGVSRGVEVAPGCPSFGPCGSLFRVHPHAAHANEVDDEAAIAGAEAGDAVAAATYGEV